MHTRSSDENSVRPFARMSNACIVTKRKKDTFRYFYKRVLYERSFSLVFWEEQWLVAGDPFYLKFWVNSPHWSEIADFGPIIVRSASAVTTIEKSSINANRKSTIRAFQWAYDDHRTLPLSPPKLKKRKTAVFPLKSYFAWRKSATKFLHVKTVSDIREIYDMTKYCNLREKLGVDIEWLTHANATVDELWRSECGE